MNPREVRGIWQEEQSTDRGLEVRGPARHLATLFYSCGSVYGNPRLNALPLRAGVLYSSTEVSCVLTMDWPG